MDSAHRLWQARSCIAVVGCCLQICCAADSLHEGSCIATPGCLPCANPFAQRALYVGLVPACCFARQHFCLRRPAFEAPQNWVTKSRIVSGRHACHYWKVCSFVITFSNIDIPCSIYMRGRCFPSEVDNFYSPTSPVITTGGG